MKPSRVSGEFANADGSGLLVRPATALASTALEIHAVG